ncbi:(Fe-S)-binding protein [Desulfosediminicola flagellatus]|uniref:(Fe-S)-binding protein n=1 Tax=Desulfosediminicola flagellatus TaxID=2569541 RepID=UPI0010AD7FDF|nr:(Fe-S)-binding protein [Desulfosediminicola flagellatus]
MQNTTGNCGKCGICLTVCPVFKVLKEEQASPRARVQLIRAYEDKKLPSSPLLKELISKCVMCGSCAAICPSGVDHNSKFMEMRSELIAAEGDRVEIRGLVYLLAKEQRLRLSMGMARMGQAVLPDFLAKKYKLGNIAVTNYPKLNKKPFRSTIPEEIAPEGEERGTVLYFTGCATNYIFDQTGFATISLLSKMGYRVITPKKQCCCSIPMLYHGGVKEAQANIQNNVACFDRESIDAILVDCPTCGSALKKEFPAMMRKFGLDAEAADRIAAKTQDLMSFVYANLEHLNFEETNPACEKNVTYHLPCHLKNSFVSAERLLDAIPAIEYTPAANGADCCGGGGTFFYEYPDVSKKMASTKIESARETGAALWLTDCPVCRINLEGQLDDDDTLTMMHPAVYLLSLLQK